MGCPCRPFLVDFMVWMMEPSDGDGDGQVVPDLVAACQGCDSECALATTLVAVSGNKKWSGVNLLLAID